MADGTEPQNDDAQAYLSAILAFALLGVFVVTAFAGGWIIGGLGWGLVGLSVSALVSAYLVGSE